MKYKYFKIDNKIMIDRNYLVKEIYEQIARHPNMNVKQRELFLALAKELDSLS